MTRSHEGDDLATQIRLTARLRYLTSLTAAAAAAVMLGFARNDTVLAAGALTLTNTLVMAVYAFRRRPRPMTSGRAPGRWRMAQPSAGFIHLIAVLSTVAVLLIMVSLLPG